MTDVTEYLCVLTQSVPKLGRAGGELSFKLLTSLDKRQLFMIMTASEGCGYFSREIVPFSALMACLPEDKTEAFLAKRFAVAFQGKSANQSGLCVAILRGLQFLRRPRGIGPYATC